MTYSLGSSILFNLTQHSRWPVTSPSAWAFFPTVFHQILQALCVSPWSKFQKLIFPHWTPSCLWSFLFHFFFHCILSSHWVPFPYHSFNYNHWSSLCHQRPLYHCPHIFSICKPDGCHHLCPSILPCHLAILNFTYLLSPLPLVFPTVARESSLLFSPQFFPFTLYTGLLCHWRAFFATVFHILNEPSFMPNYLPFPFFPRAHSDTGSFCPTKPYFVSRSYVLPWSHQSQDYHLFNTPYGFYWLISLSFPSKNSIPAAPDFTLTLTQYDLVPALLNTVSTQFISK